MTGLGSSCGGCKFLRRRCTSECVFAPYFCYEQAADHFAAVHKVFGASNVSKQLLHLPVHNRSEAAITISYEALARIHDPVYGCVAHIIALQQQVASLQEEIEILGSQMANVELDVFDFGSLQEAHKPNNGFDGLEFSSLYPEMIINQCQQTQLLSETRDILGNEDFNSQYNLELAPLFVWEDQISHPYSDANLTEELLQLQKIQSDSSRCLWLNNAGSILS